MATDFPDAERLTARFLLQFGSTQGEERKLADYTEPSSTSGNQGFVFSESLAGGATNQSIDISDRVSTATFISITDRGNKGFKYSLSNTGTKTEVAPNGFIAFKNGATVPPTIYLDAVDPTDATLVEIAVAGHSA